MALVRKPTPSGVGSRYRDVWTVSVRFLQTQRAVRFVLVFDDYGEALHAFKVVSKHLIRTAGEGVSVTLGWRG